LCSALTRQKHGYMNLGIYIAYFGLTPGGGGCASGGVPLDAAPELVLCTRRMGQPTQRAANYTARSNIEPAQSFPHANGQSTPRLRGCKEAPTGFTRDRVKMPRQRLANLRSKRCPERLSKSDQLFHNPTRVQGFTLVQSLRSSPGVATTSREFAE